MTTPHKIITITFGLLFLLFIAFAFISEAIGEEQPPTDADTFSFKVTNETIHVIYEWEDEPTVKHSATSASVPCNPTNCPQGF